MEPPPTRRDSRTVHMPQTPTRPATLKLHTHGTTEIGSCKIEAKAMSPRDEGSPTSAIRGTGGRGWVVIGVDPHKASHALVAVGVAFSRPRPQWPPRIQTRRSEHSDPLQLLVGAGIARCTCSSLLTAPARRKGV